MTKLFFKCACYHQVFNGSTFLSSSQLSVSSPYWYFTVVFYTHSMDSCRVMYWLVFEWSWRKMRFLLLMNHSCIIDWSGRLMCVGVHGKVGIGGVIGSLMLYISYMWLLLCASTFFKTSVTLVKWWILGLFLNDVNPCNWF